MSPSLSDSSEVVKKAFRRSVPPRHTYLRDTYKRAALESTRSLASHYQQLHSSELFPALTCTAVVGLLLFLH
jgi:hypothetical protein